MAALEQTAFANQQEGNALHSFLSEFLKANQVNEVKQKLNDELSFEDLMAFPESDLRDVLNELGLKKLFIAKIIKQLKTRDNAQVNQTKSMIRVLISPEENNAFGKLNKIHKQVSDGSNSIQLSIDGLKSNRENALKTINGKFSEIYKQMEARKIALIKQVDNITKNKNKTLQQQLQKIVNYRDVLQTANKSYDKLLQDDSLDNEERKNKNVKNIENAIESDVKYESFDPSVNNTILVEFDDGFIAKIKAFGEVRASVKAPTINVNDIKWNQCKVAIECDDMKSEKYDEKALDKNDLKVIETKEKEAIIGGLNKNAHYLLFARSYSSSLGFSNKSNVITFKTELQASPVKWNQTKCGSSATFVNANRVKFGSEGTVVADYVVDQSKVDMFEWTITIHEYSNDSHFGIVDASRISEQIWDKGLYTGKYDSNLNIGIGDGYTKIRIFARNDNKETNIDMSKSKNGDKYKFVADMKKKQIRLYHNNEDKGIIFENVFTSFIPAVSGYSRKSEYAIEAVKYV